MPVTRRPPALPLPPRPASQPAPRLGVILALLVACATVLTACASSGAPGPPDSSGSESREGAAGAPGNVAAPEWDASPSSLAAIGDSITRAFDACEVLADCPEMSWATGSDAAVSSLAHRLLGGGADSGAWNLAESGARASDLPDQARRAAAREPDLVTVLIGANDACRSTVRAMTPVADFRADVAEAMEIVRAELPETQFYIASVPDLMRLWSEGSSYATARTIWNVADICPSMLGEPMARTAEADERREEVRTRVQEYNAALRELCTADALCRHDAGAVFDYPFTPAELSDWDWFHPSREGQSTLAALAYERITAG